MFSLKKRSFLERLCCSNVQRSVKPFTSALYPSLCNNTHTHLFVFWNSDMLLSNYFDIFVSDPVLSTVMKLADALSVRLAPLVQIFRGALLALAIYPFRSVIFTSKYGWLKLFWLLYVLTSIGAVITYTTFSYNPLIGVPEITLQMLAFSWLFARPKITSFSAKA